MTVITRKNFVRYSILPGVVPRLKNLFGTGFDHIAYFIALVYQAARLLPPNHPYANPDNIGRFGLRHVLAEAANNLVLDRKNIDQILLFGTILFGLVLIFAQIILFSFSLLVQPVLAAMPTSFAGFFLTPDATREQDLAHIFMDMVFGVPGVFDSCVALRNGCRDIDGVEIVGPTLTNPNGAWILNDLGFPFPIHDGLHALFQIYSTGLLVVATFITLYFMAAVVVETMQTGTAFGKRFNKVWAPVRIVVAFGLLVPIANGLNSSQYIVLYAAKYGSGFATNGWNIFNENLSETYLGNVETLVSHPNVPEVGGLLQFMYVARTCAELERIENGEEVQAYLVRDSRATPSWMRMNDAFYEDMIEFIDGAKQVSIRFGIENHAGTVEGTDANRTSPQPGYKAGIRPLCGEIVIPLTDPRNPANTGSTTPGVSGPERGPEIMQRYYWYVIYELWDIVFDLDAPFEELDPIYGDIATYFENYPRNFAEKYAQWDHDPNAPLPPPEYKAAVQEFYIKDLEAALTDPTLTGLEGQIDSSLGAIKEQQQSGSWLMNDPANPGQRHPILEKGWAAAGAWYSKVAELNGALSSSVLNIPIAKKYPEVMERVYQKKRQQDQNVSMSRRFEPVLSNKQDIPDLDPADRQMSVALWRSFDYWQQGGFTSTSHTAPSKNFFIDFIKALFGTEGLYSIRKNPNVHPLAQLVGVGRSLVESATRNLGYIAVGGISGLLGSLADQVVGQGASVLIGIAMTIVMLCLTAGFVLFYIIPFLPFIYFFFAVGGWVKGIFQAMVGAPLWALAHIRIDGNGLPGQAAANGYFLIFEIFIRPILIIFGLLAAISIFSAMVAVLNEIWDLVTSNMTGFDVRSETTNVGGQSLVDYQRNPIDQFFFTVVYTILVYMMAMSSFKLIDLIPNNILRWMGSSVSSFNDMREDAAQSMVGTSYIGGQQAISQIGGGLQQGLQQGVTLGSKL